MACLKPVLAPCCMPSVRAVWRCPLDFQTLVNVQVDQTQLRLYERSKLRYYYAIVEFDSVDTATRIYTECDGLEFQLTSCKFDLRFVPDEQVLVQLHLVLQGPWHIEMQCM